MSDSNQRHKQRQEKVALLPESLRTALPLRYVEDYLKLSRKAQETARQAIEQGVAPSTVIREMKQYPDLDLEALLVPRFDILRETEKTGDTGKTSGDTDYTNEIADLAELIHFCFPSLTHLAAESLAVQPPNSFLLPVIAGLKQARTGGIENQEISAVILYGLILATLQPVEELFVRHPFYQRFLKQSGLLERTKSNTGNREPVFSNQVIELCDEIVNIRTELDYLDAPRIGDYGETLSPSKRLRALRFQLRDQNQN